MQGEIKKLNFVPKTIDNSIVKDGLQAVSLLNNKSPYYLVGGIAVQSYLPSKCRRPTSDVDFSIVEPLAYESFKKIMNPVREYFEDTGYKTDFQKGSRSYCLNVQNLTGEEVCLEFSRRNENCFNKHKKRLEREFNNSNMKIVEGRDVKYRVACPEDTAIPKLVRLVGSLQRNPSFEEFLPKKGKIKSLSEEIIKEQLENIRELRKLSMNDRFDKVLFDRLRFVSDVYDIRILSEITGFNELYWKEGIKEFSKLFSISTTPLMESILPFNN